MDRPVVLYDVDCGFCRSMLAAFLAWDRHRDLRPVAIQSAEGERLLEGMAEEDRLASWHFVAGADGPVSGGAAAPPLLRRLPGGRPPATLLATFPGATDRAYRWVARHRTQLSKLVPAAVKRRSDALVARRS